MPKGKLNPRRRPATMLDVKKAKKEAQNEGVSLAVCLILSALLDKGFLDTDSIRPAWDAINSMSDSIIRGYVNLNDLRRVLAEEYGIYT